MSRRSLLVGGSALAALAACGKSAKSDLNVPKDTSTTGGGQKDVLSVVQAGFNFQTGIDERVTFALFEGVPASLVGADTVVNVAFQKPGTRVLTDSVVAVRKSEGIEERPYYVVHYPFDVSGNWGLRATVAGKKPGDLVITVDDPMKVTWPTPGTSLPKVASPTPSKPLGVNPICTRTPSPCPFHDHSLDTVVGNGKPTIVLLATPALCMSATCGPVLDILMAETTAVATKLNILHVEVYADSSGKTASPAFTAFNTQNEPVLYLADKKGIVTDRLNGPFDRSEAREAIARLLA